MKQLQIDEQKARSRYQSASPELKAILEDTFGKEFFSEYVEDRINSFEDALNETGRPKVPDFSCVPEDLRDFFKATYKCVVIAEALNEGKRFDLYNESEYRYYPYFRNNGSASAFGLDVAYFGSASSTAGSGSRLAFVDSKKAKIAGEKFKNEFRDMLSL
ncbi:MAG TPA: hypothetical protein VIK29_07140 [Paludibacter sp.]